MVYGGEFVIASKYYNIPIAPLISDGEIIVEGHIMVMVFDFFDRTVETCVLYQFTKNIKRHNPIWPKTVMSPLLICGTAAQP